MANSQSLTEHFRQCDIQITRCIVDEGTDSELRAGTVLLDDVSHYPPREAPDEVAAATLALLAEQNSSTSTAR